jgi:hypothetical protein
LKGKEVALLPFNLHKMRTFQADDDDGDDDDDKYDSGNCLLHNVFKIPPANYNPTS